MNGYILHGENTKASRQKLTEIKSQFEPEATENGSLETGFLPQNQMFGQTRLTVFEVFEKEKLRQLEPESFFGNLGFLDPSLTVVFWFGFELPASSKVTALAKRNGFKEIKFGVSPLVFKLTDAFFAPRNLKPSFYQILSDFDRDSGEDVFLVQMLIRGARLKLWACLKNKSYGALSPFVRKQAVSTQPNKEKLLELFEKLTDLERKVKGDSVDFISNLLLLYESF